MAVEEALVDPVQSLSDDFSFVATYARHRYTFACSGELDASIAAQFGEIVMDMSRKQPDLTDVIFDLNRVTFIDSSALRVLVTTSLEAQKSGYRFGVINPSAPVTHLLEQTNLAETMIVSGAGSEGRSVTDRAQP